MDLGSWLVKFVIEALQERFQRLETQRDALAELARRAHEDAAGGECPGAGACKFCDKLAEALAEG